MKTKVLTMACIMAFAFGAPQTAGAQLGKIISKAKKAVKDVNNILGTQDAGTGNKGGRRHSCRGSGADTGRWRDAKPACKGYGSGACGCIRQELFPELRICLPCPEGKNEPKHDEGFVREREQR